MKRKLTSLFLFTMLFLHTMMPSEVSWAEKNEETPSSEEEPVVLRICNWEEYIDEGDWDEEEAIDLSEDNVIIGQNSMMEDFEQWYYEEYGVRVEVEYSTFGTNEDLFNQLNLGDTYDLVCPSEYMIMKLMVKGKLEPYSDDFFDREAEHNYYAKGVSPYIRQVFESNEIGGETWAKYAAGYMWGTTGIVYNPEEVPEEDASTWAILNNEKYNRKVTIKDNVRDAYFAALGIYKRELLLEEGFLLDKDYHDNLSEVMNDVTPETINEVEKILKDIKDNVYSFETDSGKSDMVTGKIVANYQWSGDAVYTLDQAEEDGLYLNYAVPEESTNLWFDGWVMLKDGINGDEAKKQAAQAFVNFVSRPDNVVRNMYYIGYTSVISGGEDSTVFDYVDWCYGAEEEEKSVEYNLDYFFSGKETGEYIIATPKEQLYRQLFAQYPTKEVIDRSAVMNYFDDEASVNINQMWINVRCFDLNQIPEPVLILAGVAFIFVVVYIIFILFVSKKLKKM
ncbi:MAG: extracellular solute-binding protein [Lachnospiraceae bacterium]|nr:extracellular solute-binding protein [Lachnospiraceae bacterium]